MEINYDDILSVLALFDDSDIPYIKSEIYLKYRKEEKKDSKVKVKQKKVGDDND